LQFREHVTGVAWCGMLLMLSVVLGEIRKKPGRCSEKAIERIRHERE